MGLNFGVPKAMFILLQYIYDTYYHYLSDAFVDTNQPVAPRELFFLLKIPECSE